MTEARDVLAPWDRKERNAVIHTLLDGTELPLSAKFCTELTAAFADAAIDLVVPPTAWWRIDYHIDWLIGAQEIWECDESGPILNDDNRIEGCQRDFDVVIAFGNVIVLVEAKAHEAWEPEQLDGKLRQLRKAGLTYQGARHERTGLQHYLALMSINNPATLVEKVPLARTWQGPSGVLPCVGLLTARSAFLRPQRCTEGGHASNKGTYWQVVEEPVVRGTAVSGRTAQRRGAAKAKKTVAG